MKSIKFDRSNTVYAENQPEYLSLPAHRDVNGEVTTCWKFTFKERLKLLFSPLYIRVLTFNAPLQPMKLYTKKPLCSIRMDLPNPDEEL